MPAPLTSKGPIRRAQSLTATSTRMLDIYYKEGAHKAAVPMQEPEEIIPALPPKSANHSAQRTMIMSLTEADEFKREALGVITPTTGASEDERAFPVSSRRYEASSEEEADPSDGSIADDEEEESSDGSEADDEESVVIAVAADEAEGLDKKLVSSAESGSMDESDTSPSDSGMEDNNAEEINDVTRVEVSCPGGHVPGTTRTTPENSKIYLDLPRTTLRSKNDPMLFYRIPHGFGLWEGAQALMAVLPDLAERHRFLESRSGRSGAELSVIELGSGAAPLPALCVEKLARRNGGETLIVSTDHIDSLVDRAERNVQLNSVAGDAGDRASSETVKHVVQKLSWGNREHVDGALKLLQDRDPGVEVTPGVARGEAVACSTGGTGEAVADSTGGTPELTTLSEDDSVTLGDAKGFDVILGADLVTNSYSMSALADTINQLAGKNSLLILAVNRRVVETEEAFMESLNGALSGPAGEVAAGKRWEMLETIEDKPEERWSKLGRVGHNAGSSRPETIFVWVLKCVQ